MPETKNQTETIVELFVTQAGPLSKHLFEVHRSPRPEPGQDEPEPLHTSPPNYSSYTEAVKAGLAYAEKQGWQPVI